MLIIFTNYSHKTKLFSSAEPHRLSLCTLCWSGPPPYLRPDDKGPRCIRHACPPAHRLSPRRPLQDKTYHISCHIGPKIAVLYGVIKDFSGVCSDSFLSGWCGGYLAQGVLFHCSWQGHWEGRRSPTKGRTASCCHGGPEEDLQPWAHLRSRQERTQHRRLSACLYLSKAINMKICKLILTVVIPVLCQQSNKINIRTYQITQLIFTTWESPLWETEGSSHVQYRWNFYLILWLCSILDRPHVGRYQWFALVPTASAEGYPTAGGRPSHQRWIFERRCPGTEGLDINVPSLLVAAPASCCFPKTIHRSLEETDTSVWQNMQVTLK